MLSSADLNPQDDVDVLISDFFNQLVSLDREDGGIDCKISSKYRAFSEERVRGVLGALSEIDGKIANSLENWDLPRLGTVERAVLRLGVWELKYTDIDRAVVINEAIDIVKFFATRESRNIVNAVLDKCAVEFGR